MRAVRAMGKARLKSICIQFLGVADAFEGHLWSWIFVEDRKRGGFEMISQLK